MAAGVRDQLFVFGGYVEDAQGAIALPDVGMYEPSRDRWLRGADIPLAVGDSVIGVYRDRFVYLVSGRSNGGVVNNVQVYDAQKNNGRKPRRSGGRRYSAMPARWSTGPLFMMEPADSVKRALTCNAQRRDR